MPRLFRHNALRIAAGAGWCSACIWAASVADASPPAERFAPPPRQEASIRRPIGPGAIPQTLPGRWLISLCVSADHGHAWIRYENVETGQVRSISRFHMLVGGWFDREQGRWHYPPTLTWGLSMDRDQRYEQEIRDGGVILLFTYLEDPPVYFGNGPYGHGVVRNNCVTYSRDAWHFYTGEFYELPLLHTPSDLIEAVEEQYPDARGPQEQPEASGPQTR